MNIFITYSILSKLIDQINEPNRFKIMEHFNEDYIEQGLFFIVLSCVQNHNSSGGFHEELTQAYEDFLDNNNIKYESEYNIKSDSKFFNKYNTIKVYNSLHLLDDFKLDEGAHTMVSPSYLDRQQTTLWETEHLVCVVNFSKLIPKECSTTTPTIAKAHDDIFNRPFGRKLSVLDQLQSRKLIRSLS